MGRPCQGYRTPDIPRPRGNADSREVTEHCRDLLPSRLSDLLTTGQSDTLPSIPRKTGHNKYYPDAVRHAHCPCWLVCSCAIFPGRATGSLSYTFYAHCHGDRPDLVNQSPVAWFYYFCFKRSKQRGCRYSYLAWCQRLSDRMACAQGGKVCCSGSCYNGFCSSHIGSRVCSDGRWKYKGSHQSNYHSNSVGGIQRRHSLGNSAGYDPFVPCAYHQHCLEQVAAEVSDVFNRSSGNNPQI